MESQESSKVKAIRASLDEPGKSAATLSGTVAIWLSPAHLTRPSCSSGLSLPLSSTPGMGNGVQEGSVHLREDAEAVLSGAVSSKASSAISLRDSCSQPS